MSKILECAKVDPSSGCNYVIRGNSVEEILQSAGEHIKAHGVREFTPEMIAKVKSYIRDV